MIGSQVACRDVAELVGQWHAGTLPAAGVLGYEEHLLFCPPCLRQHDKAGLAAAALRAAACGPPPPEPVRAALAALLTAPAAED